MAEQQTEIGNREKILEAIGRIETIMRDFGTYLIGFDMENLNSDLIILRSALNRLPEVDDRIAPFLADREVDQFRPSISTVSIERAHDHARFYKETGEIGYKANGRKLIEHGVDKDFVNPATLLKGVEAYLADERLNEADIRYLTKIKTKLSRKPRPVSLSAREVLVTEKVFHKVDGYGDQVVLPHRYYKGKNVHMGVAEHKESMEGARKALENFRDYLYALDREGLRDFVEGKTHFGAADPTRVLKRVERLLDADIPPIFIEDMESVSENGRPFPLLDYIILFGSGKLGDRMSAARLNANMARRTIDIPRAYPREIMLFAQKAFDNGERVPQLDRDLAFRVVYFTHAKGKNQPEYMGNYPVAIEFLRDMLTAFIPQTRVYPRKFEDGMNVNFVCSTEPWYLDFSPEDRIRIAERFKEMIYRNSLIVRGRTTSKEMAIQRMHALFPEVVEITREDILVAGTRQRYTDAIASGQYDRVPQLIFVDPQYQQLKLDFLTLLEQKIQNHRQTKPDDFLKPLKGNGVGRRFGLNEKLVYIHEIADIIHKYRLDILQNMSDADFQTRFPTNQFTAALGIRHADRGTTCGNALHDYVVQRYKDLKP